MEVIALGSEVMVGGNVPAIVVGIWIGSGPQVLYPLCILVNDGSRIEVFDEAMMNAAGWYRKPVEKPPLDDNDRTNEDWREKPCGICSRHICRCAEFNLR